MSMNKQVTMAAEDYMAAVVKFGFGSRECEDANDVYFKTMEAEAKKDLDNACGWLDWEDPTDTLIEDLEDKEDKDVVKRDLDDYLRFWQMYERLYGKSDTDDELVLKAKRYIA